MYQIQSLFFMIPMFLTCAVLGVAALFACLNDLVIVETVEETVAPGLARATVVLDATVIVAMPCIQVRGSNVPKGFGSGALVWT